MRKTRYTEEQIIRVLQQVEAGVDHRHQHPAPVVGGIGRLMGRHTQRLLGQEAPLRIAVGRSRRLLARRRRSHGGEGNTAIEKTAHADPRIPLAGHAGYWATRGWRERGGPRAPKDTSRGRPR